MENMILILINPFSQNDRQHFKDWKDVKFDSKFMVLRMSDTSTNRSKAPQTDEVGSRGNILL